MLKSLYSDSNLYKKILLIFIIPIFLLIISTVLVGLIGGILLMSDSSINIETNKSFLQVAQTVISICTFGLGAYCCAFLISKNTNSFLNTNKTSNLKNFIYAIVITLCAVPAVGLLTEWNNSIVFPECLRSLEAMFRNSENEAIRATKLLLSGSGFVDYIIAIFVIAVVPAICEELLFRGVFQNLFAKHFNIHIAIWLAAFIFSAIHFQFYGFAPRMILGAVLGYLLYYTGSIWVPIMAHFTNNAIGVSSVFYNPNSFNLSYTEVIGNDILSYSLAGISCVAVVSLLFAMRSRSLRR